MAIRRVLVDTNILIDFLRTGYGDWTDLLKLQQDGIAELYLSCVSIFELFSGKSSKISDRPIVAMTTTCSILSLTQDQARLAGEIRRDVTESLTIADLFIAAAALELELELATRNVRHFQGILKLKFFNFR